ncbi:GNAT family N-acetyltransferase [Proteiniborus sp. MB09-C3]|uniref:GNAT family N-acetyltransferase n=1 Tax=Proteiniborus sp. MB09-C3 TaxID=3050072 RepID=UPI0025524E7E|nr:GNAT family N-acetyltransferase [Proteiniborus sp. MB09-C3]WIV11551.1 GNAT family N-acetyltransferase [Proteiniborus sp. MB09-C3]
MVTLEKITWDNWEACMRLRVTDEQDDFISSNMYSLAQSYVALLNDELPPMTYAICEDSNVIGFVMMYHDTAEENDYSEESYGVCRFMIDRDFQGKGYGKKAFAKALELIKTFPQGNAVSVFLSYHPKNEAARKLYASFGFVETGDISGGEVVARLAL